METKELNTILVEILLKRDSFTYLKERDFNDTSTETLSKLLQKLLEKNYIFQCTREHAGNTNYTIFVPQSYSLTADGINHLNNSLSLYTYNNGQYYRIRINKLHAIVGIPLPEENFDYENEILIPSNLVEI